MAKTVLIVEDNELNMKLFRDLLEAHGYQTVGTSNGREALNLARQHRPNIPAVALDDMAADRLNAGRLLAVERARADERRQRRRVGRDDRRRAEQAGVAQPHHRRLDRLPARLLHQHRADQDLELRRGGDDRPPVRLVAEVGVQRVVEGEQP